jgi:hypothetical protein
MIDLKALWEEEESKRKQNFAANPRLQNPSVPKYQTGGQYDPTPASTTGVFMPPMPSQKIIEQGVRRQDNERLAQEFLSKYPNAGYSGAIPSQGTIDYPHTDSRSQNYSGNPNMAFARAGRTGAVGKMAEDNFNIETLGALTPLVRRIAQTVKSTVPIKSTVPKMQGTVHKAGMSIDPIKLADDIIPNPTTFTGLGDNFWRMSPLSYTPGYGKNIGKKGVAFRKFGNTLEHIKSTGTLSPKGGSNLRMGKTQIIGEGNWAAMNKPDEGYKGVFEATLDKTVPGADLAYSGSRTRNGVLVTKADGSPYVDIPLSEPGLSFNRRLPFSTKYVPVDKEKLASGQFQLSTLAPNTQSLVEKYAAGLSIAGAGGALGGDAATAIEEYNRYTIDPIVKAIKDLNPNVEYRYGGKPYLP